MLAYYLSVKDPQVVKGPAPQTMLPTGVRQDSCSLLIDRLCNQPQG